MSSRNIFLLRDESKRIDYSSPFSLWVWARTTFRRNIIPPDRQDYPNNQFQRLHDLYSFGVLLTEIGLWQPADELFEGKKGIAAEEIKRSLAENCETRLAYYIGTNYRSATLTCLKEGFGIDADDSAYSSLSKAFELWFCKISPAPKVQADTSIASTLRTLEAWFFYFRPIINLRAVFMTQCVFPWLAVVEEFLDKESTLDAPRTWIRQVYPIIASVVAKLSCVSKRLT